MTRVCCPQPQAPSPAREAGAWAPPPCGHQYPLTHTPCPPGGLSHPPQGSGGCPGWVELQSVRKHLRGLEVPTRPRHDAPPRPSPLSHAARGLEGRLARGAVMGSGRGCVLGQHLVTPHVGANLRASPRGLPALQTLTRLLRFWGPLGTPLPRQTPLRLCLTIHK